VSHLLYGDFKGGGNPFLAFLGLSPWTPFRPFIKGPFGVDLPTLLKPVVLFMIFIFFFKKGKIS